MLCRATAIIIGSALPTWKAILCVAGCSARADAMAAAASTRPPVEAPNERRCMVRTFPTVRDKAPSYNDPPQFVTEACICCAAVEISRYTAGFALKKPDFQRNAN